MLSHFSCFNFSSLSILLLWGKFLIVYVGLDALQNAASRFVKFYIEATRDGCQIEFAV